MQCVTVSGLPVRTGGLPVKRHISITMEFASRTISPVTVISCYGSEGLISSISMGVVPVPLLNLKLLVSEKIYYNLLASEKN